MVPRFSDARLKQLFQNRIEVHEEVKKYIKLDSKYWPIIEHYYNLRCKLVHERATVGLIDEQIEDFREVVEIVLKELFDLKFD